MADVQEAPREVSSRVWFFRVWTAVGVVVLIVGVGWLFRGPLALIVPPLALALVLAYLLNPVVTWFSHRGVPRVLGAAAAYAVMLSAITVVMVLAGPVLLRQAQDLLQELPAISESLQGAINEMLARVGSGQRIQIELGAPETREAIQRFLENNQDEIMALVRGAGSLVSSLLHGLLIAILTPFLAFYLLVDMPRIGAGIRRLVPPRNRGEVVDVAGRIGSSVGAYFRGLLLVALFVGTATAAGLGLVGLPFWAIVGGAAGLFNLVPLVGPWVGGFLGVLVAVSVGDGLGQALAVVIVMVVVQQIDNHIITPNIVARTVQVHPITVILGLVVGASLFGILGMFLAIPVVATIKLVLLYVLVTRAPSMRHLAGDGRLFEDDGDEPPEGTMIALGRELRRGWAHRRHRQDDRGGDEQAGEADRTT